MRGKAAETIHATCVYVMRKCEVLRKLSGEGIEESFELAPCTQKQAEDELRYGNISFTAVYLQKHPEGPKRMKIRHLN